MLSKDWLQPFFYCKFPTLELRGIWYSGVFVRVPLTETGLHFPISIADFMPRSTQCRWMWIGSRGYPLVLQGLVAVTTSKTFCFSLLAISVLSDKFMTVRLNLLNESASRGNWLMCMEHRITTFENVAPVVHSLSMSCVIMIKNVCSLRNLPQQTVFLHYESRSHIPEYM